MYLYDMKKTTLHVIMLFVIFGTGTVFPQEKSISSCSGGMIQAGEERQWVKAGFSGNAADEVPDYENRSIQEKWLSVFELKDIYAGESSGNKPVIFRVFILVTLFLLAIFLFQGFLKKKSSESVKFDIRRMRITTLVILAFCMTCILTITIYSVRNIRNNAVEKVHDNLDVVLSTVTEVLTSWIDKNLTQVRMETQKEDFVSRVSNITAVPSDRETLLKSEELRNFRDYFSRENPYSFSEGFFIISDDGINIASHDDESIGRANFVFKNRPELLELAFLGKSMFIPPVLREADGWSPGSCSQSCLFYAVPVLNSENNVIAVMIQREDPEKDFGRFCRMGRIGESGETYAFDRNGFMLTNSRFDDQLLSIGLLKEGSVSALNIQLRDPGVNLLEGENSPLNRDDQPFTLMFRHASSSEFGYNIEGYRDYRGVDVFGAWRWFDEYNFGIASEIDITDALSSYSTIQTAIYIIIAIAFFLASGTTLFSIHTGERANKSLSEANENLEKRVAMRTAELSEARNKTEAILEASTNGIITIDEKGIIETFNPAAEHIFGYSKDEVIGQNVKILMPLEYSEKHDGYLGNYIDTGIKMAIGRRFEKEGLRKSGQLIPLEIGINEVHLKDRRLFTAIMNDISERKASEEALITAKRNNEFAAETAGLAYWEQDLTEKTFTVNDSFFKLADTSYVREGCYVYPVNEFLDQFVYPGDLDKVVEKFLEAEKTTSDIADQFEYRLVLRSGGFRYGYMKYFVIHDSHGNAVKITGIHLDITERKKIEMELAEAKEAAEAAAKIKSDFLANMSHEIRTPMNAIIGLSHLISKTRLTKKQEDYIHKIFGSAHNLLGIINDILDFSKIEAGKLAMESVDFDLNEVFDNLGNMIAGKAYDKKLELVFHVNTDVPVKLVGDPLRLGQVLLNLANNAVKFTEAGEIAVSAELVNLENNEAEIKFIVRDTGIGLTEDQMNTLFQAFSQADTSTTRKYGGTGLGLSISKKLSEMMGGRIWVESIFGEGSTFYFTGKYKVRHVETHKIFPAGLRGLDVLIADDNSTSQKVLLEYLKDFELNPVAVDNGTEAVQIIRKRLEDGVKGFDLVLLDFSMPGLNGFQTAEKINEILGKNERPRYILVTGFGRDEVINGIERYGFEGFLLKPVNQSLLFNTIMQAFGRERKDTGKTITEKFPNGFDSIRGAEILLVEDNEINQQVAREVLEREGFSVDVADNGEISLEMLSEKKYDLVLMDLQMPVMGGVEATGEIRKNDEFKELPVIAMTADAMSGVREMVLEKGMNDYITKPIEPYFLWKTMVKWIVPGEGKFSDINRMERPSEEAGENPEIDGLDINSGLNRMSGNFELYKNLLIKFFREYTDLSMIISEDAENGRTDDAVRTAHSVKGVSGNLGATKIQVKMADIENKLKNSKDYRDDLSEAESMIRNLAEKAEKAGLLENQEEPSDKSMEISREELTARLTIAVDSLSRRKPRTAITVLEELGKCDFDKETGEKLSEARTLLARYRMKEASELLRGIIG